MTPAFPPDSAGSGRHEGRRLAIATVIALMVAALLLLAAVLPAEYGVDPLGTGKALGLLDLYRGATDPSGAATTPAPAAAVPPMTMFKVDSVVFKLRSS